MFGRLHWLLIAAIVVSPVTVDLRHGFTWSEVSAQDIWSLNCDPVYRVAGHAPLSTTILCRAHVCPLGSVHLGGQDRLWFARAK